jgi:exonuclease-1
MKRVELLQRAGVTPVIVFDGGRLPMKAEEEAARARRAQRLLPSASFHPELCPSDCRLCMQPARSDAGTTISHIWGEGHVASSGTCRGRQENLEKARAHWAAGNTAAAYECYQRAVDISPATAKRFIDVLALSLLPISACMPMADCLED